MGHYPEKGVFDFSSTKKFFVLYVPKNNLPMYLSNI